MAHKLKNLTITRVALVPAGSNPHADVVLFKSKPVPPQPKEPVFMKKNIDTSKLSTEEQAQMTALLAKSATDIPDAGPGPEDEDEKIIKSLPLEAQAIINKAKTDAAAAVEAANKASETALFEKHARETNEFVSDNVELMKAYPGKADDNTKLLYRVKKAVSPEDYKAIETILKAGNAALAATTKETGSTVGDDSSETGIMKELSDKAHARAAEKKITYAKAYDEILGENEDKVKEVRKAKKRREKAQDDND